MRIIYISQHFPPEIGAAQGRAYDMAKNLKALDHDVTVLTMFSNDQMTTNWYKRETIDGIDVRRSFRVRDTKTSAKRRLANYLSFMASSSVAGLFTKKPDVVYATSPQLFNGLAGYFLSKVYRAKFVFEVRDLWVDFAELLGQFSQPLLLKLARKLENFLYQKADLIITVTEGYKTRLMDQGIPEQRIKVITNGVDPDTFPSDDIETDVRKELGIEDKLVILFAGNMGAAQGLDAVIDAAERLQQEEQPVHFLFIGYGVEKEKLKAKAHERNLNNVQFFNSMKKHELSAYYKAADMCLVTLKKHPLFSITIPSKVFDCMAANKPILIGVDGEARAIVESNHAGVYFEPENAIDLVEKITAIIKQKDTLLEMEQNIKDIVLQKYNRQHLAKKLAKYLEETVDHVNTSKGNGSE
ncbi:glycosyltransferase family 4 protein [Alkalihalobacillus sp. BA299]|uniref:glycosyltransferase family 4 protein n=1 Tax=Alkalihalobacillus sp. BA299 TaxID=2815938 RepID=UPI001ADB7763|nr:glycosyltransferase family 4 protein [Alkalihalobacillus sp. BA299]